MTITIKSNNNYNRLKELQDNYPALTFNNVGYQGLTKEIKENHREEIKEIESILKSMISNFSSFKNFKPRKDGGLDVRMQVYYDERFIGVCYIDLEEFKKKN